MCVGVCAGVDKCECVCVRVCVCVCVCVSPNRGKFIKSIINTSGKARDPYIVDWRMKLLSQSNCTSTNTYIYKYIYYCIYIN